MAKSAFLFRRKKGDVLQPGRFTPAVVRGLKARPREWAGQYQQEPAPSTGLIFNPSWWQFYKTRDPLPDFDIVAISVDCAFKSKAENDFVSIQKWGATGARCYLLQKETRHLGYTATKAMIRAIQNEGLRASVVLVEDKANGSAVIEELRAGDFGADVIAVEPAGGKEARAHAASATVEAKNVFLPEDAPWLAEFLRVTAAFPVVRHDDDVDAMTQFLNWRRGRNQGELGVLELMKRRAKEIAEGIRDAFGELIRKPRPEAQPEAGEEPQQTRVDGFAVWLRTHRAPKCRACGNASTNYISRTRYRCNQCGAISDDATGQVTAPPQENLIIGVNCCGDAKANVAAGNKPLVQTVANELRCGFCGRQAHTKQVVTCGISRRDYAAGVGTRRMF
jgi:predicted phage terminase large subunit-like protein